MMTSLMPLWEENKLTFALGVGWPNPNRSHFMAMDQWSTGSETGWVKVGSQKYLIKLKMKNICYL